MTKAPARDNDDLLPLPADHKMPAEPEGRFGHEMHDCNDPLAIAGVLHIPQWTPIAWCPDDAPAKIVDGRWRDYDDAPICLHEARTLERRGLLLMAQRKIPGSGRTDVVVKSPAPRVSRTFGGQEPLKRGELRRLMAKL